MEKRYQAQHIYINYRKEEDAPRPTRSILQSLFSILVEFLSLCKPEEKFSFHEFHKILNFSSSESDFDLTKASEAFETLEFFFNYDMEKFMETRIQKNTKILWILSNENRIAFKEIRGGF